MEPKEQQTSEMVEKVAKALYEVDPDIAPTKDGGWEPMPWRADRDHSHEIQLARVAIAAMREPTMDMLDAGDSMMPQIAKGQDISTGYDALKDAWPAMVDAALSGSSATHQIQSVAPVLDSAATSDRANQERLPEPFLGPEGRS